MAISRGANLQANTPVESISESPDAEGRWTVNTTRGSIKAKHVVFSSNAYTGAIAPEYEGKIVPVRGICSRTVVPNPPKPHLPTLDSSYTVRLKEGIYEYLIARPDGSIVIGGARSVYAHDLNNWYNNTDDSRLIEVAAHHFDGYMQRYFHGWENTGAYTDRVWTGSTYPRWYLVFKWRLTFDSHGIYYRFPSTRRTGSCEARAVRSRWIQWAWNAAGLSFSERSRADDLERSRL